MPVFYSNRRERRALDMDHGGPQSQPTLVEWAFIEPSLCAKFHPTLWDLGTDGGVQAGRTRGGRSPQQCQFPLWGYRGASSPPVESSTYIHRVFKEFATHFISSESESLAIKDSPHLLHS